MADAMLATIKTIGTTVTDDSIRALDLRSREAIEALTTDTAKKLPVSSMTATATSARPPQSTHRSRFLPFPAERQPATFTSTANGSWPTTANHGSGNTGGPRGQGNPPILPDNARTFRPAAGVSRRGRTPAAVCRNDLHRPGWQRKDQGHPRQPDRQALRNVAERSNTFVKAESYFPELKS